MGRASTKENKNIYQKTREELGLTREAASDVLEYISADRIEKIESERSLPHPDEILQMAKGYKAPHLCNHYCATECPIGKESVPKIELKDLSQIVLEMLASLNALNREKERLIEITVDGKIEEDEYRDFRAIQDQLETISMTVDGMKLWLQKMIAEGVIDADKLKKAGE